MSIKYCRFYFYLRYIKFYMFLYFDNHINETEMKLSCHIECRGKCILFESVLRYKFACYSRTIIIILRIYIAPTNLRDRTMNSWKQTARRNPMRTLLSRSTQPRAFSFCHKFNFVINELLITREELFLHDFVRFQRWYFAVIEKKKISSHRKRLWIFWNILCMKSMVDQFLSYLLYFELSRLWR